jgi:para-nitrobenzyl esterase
MSGSGLKMPVRDEASETASIVLRRLGIERHQAIRLLDVPTSELLSAMVAVGPDGYWKDRVWSHGFAPVVDGVSLPRHPFDPTAPEISANVPMMFGNCGDVLSDLHWRYSVMTMAEQKSALSAAPAYLYLFTWESPAFGGKFKSSHAFDVPFVFDNLRAARVKENL